MLLNWVWQGTLVGMGAALALVPLRRATGRIRESVCWFALATVMAAPVLSLTSYGSSESVSITLPGVFPTDPGLVPGKWTAASLAGALWFTWFAWHLTQLASALLALHAARRQSRDLSTRLEQRLPHWSRVSAGGRRARLVVSDDIPLAAVLGGPGALIAVAPALLERLDDGDLDRIVVHEWMHVQRRDDAALLLQAVLLSVAGWHPAVWWLDRRIRGEREAACDDAVVEITGEGLAYAACLTNLAAFRPAGGPLPVASVLGASTLRHRVTSILCMSDRMPRWRQRLVGCAAAGSLVVLVTIVVPVRVGAAIAVGASSALSPVIADVVTIGSTASAAVRQQVGSARSPRSIRLATQNVAPAPALRLRPGASPARVVAFPVSGAVVGAETSEAPPPELQAPLPSRAAAWLADAPLLVAADAHASSGDALQEATVWRTAAQRGVAVGRVSRKAATATAGFFTRIAKRTAGTF